MNFTDIPARTLTLRIKWMDGHTGTLPDGPVLSVSPCPSRPGEFELRGKDALCFAKPVSDADVHRLTRELSAGSAILAQLANPAADDSVELQIAFFSGECRDMGAVDIGVDEYVEKQYAKVFRETLKSQRLYEALAKRCCYYHGGQPYFFFLAGPAIDITLHPGQEEGEGELPEALETEEESADGSSVARQDQSDVVLQSSPSRPQPTRKNSLCIVGNGLRFVATESIRPDGKSIYMVTRLTNSKGADRALRLAKGKLTFSDWTQAGQIEMLAKAQMTDLTRREGSYLKRWDEFVEIEGELVLAQARKIGTLQYSEISRNRDGTVTVRIAQASDSALEALEAREVESLELADELPLYLTKRDLTFTQFIGVIENEVEKEAFLNKRGNQVKESRLHYDVGDYDAVTRTLTLKTEDLPASGTLILSLTGQIAQIKRRLFARKAILEGRAANPQLGLIIEEKGVIAQTRSPSKIKPLTAFVTDKVFRNPPTEKQREAIEVALNTPDIALIQGPPGTGKTTVIAAIIERLNEEADKRGENFKGSILLTGLQHDAVENLIERLSLNGLPVPKFGRRSDSEEDDFSVFQRKLQAWCSERAIALRAKHPRLIDIEKEAQIKNLCLQYLQVPTCALALNIAKRIASMDITLVGEDCFRRASNVARRLSWEQQLHSDSNRFLESVRRLRHRPEAFADDGPERAADALDDLHDILAEDERKLLEQASLWRNEDGIPPFLTALAALKKKLMSRLTTPPVFRVEKHNDEVVALVEEACKRIRAAGISAKDAKSAALAEFLAELESDPYGMMDAVSDYAYAFAATCQQSVNRQMQRQKGILADNSALEFHKIEYEYVIVDEAARVTPPDLMVAMAQGKRIILVGDHRQLPHIIEEAVARQMEAGETGRQETEWLKKSMFQYLFSERIKMLEEADGIPRRVTLDKQYRMHPLLGKFVSRNFYERFDPSEKFGSGRAERDFAHNLQGTDGRPAVWLNVPATKGKQMRAGTSWIRPAEATAIACQLHSWMNSEAGQDLSFGVISFYKAQAELIKKQINLLAKPEDRLRIGTVDSFQGMEFDVVMLSMVRTMPENWQSRFEDEEMQARKLFGHLCLYNRLNVSMSRQRKLLVVAGDPDLLQSDLANMFIPGLVDFYNLCRTHGRVLPCP